MPRRLLLSCAAAAAAAVFVSSFAGCAGARLKLGKGERGEVVESEGWAGIDPKDAYGTKQRALAEAQRKAVERVVGVYISAKSRVSQAAEVDQNILANVGGYIRKYNVLSEREEEGFHKTRIKAVVLYERVGQDLKKAGLLRPNAPPGNPKVVVLLRAKGAYSEAADNRAAQGVRRGLLERGYSVVDRSDPAAFSSLKSTDSAAAAEVGRELGADIVVRGEAEAYALKDVRLGGFFSYRARVTLEAAKPATGEVVSSKVQEASALDPSPEIAAGKALDAAGLLAGEALGSELSELLSSRLNVTVRILGLKGLEQVQKIADDIRLLPEVSGATLAGYDRKVGAVLTVTTEKTAGDELAAALLRMRKYPFMVGAVSPYEVEVSVPEQP
ncbi:MAG: hypothetical protein HY922_15850 [Elusimicrobia bacterium]|nr:hypothetical protein [Elusimicrobiota bacterium]